MICCLIISFVVYPLFKCFKSSVYLISLEEKNQGLHNEKEVDSTKPHLTFVMQLFPSHPNSQPIFIPIPHKIVSNYSNPPTLSTVWIVRRKKVVHTTITQLLIVLLAFVTW